MRYGLCLPNFTNVASPESIDATAALAERLGWDSVWTTDHVLVDKSERAEEYQTNFDVIQTLAWVGARYPSIRLGTSVIVVPQRNAVVLAKELASLDALSGGRVIAGVGVGWSEREFANLGMSHRFGMRGAYLEETSPSGVTSGAGRASRSAAGFTSCRTTCSDRCRHAAPTCRSGSAGGPMRRSSAQAAWPLGTTRRRPRPRRWAPGSP